MSRIAFIFSLLIFAFCTATAQEDADATTTPLVNEIETQPSVLLKGNLDAGDLMPLQWAANSSVACFPATRFYEYKGNHVLYRIQMPAASKIKIMVIPKSKKTRINLYALRLGANNYDTPPEIYQAISCEAPTRCMRGNLISRLLQKDNLLSTSQ